LLICFLEKETKCLSKDETRRNSSLILITCFGHICNHPHGQVYVFLCMVLLAVRMVANVTETRNVIPRLGFKTCMSIKSQVFQLNAIFPSWCQVVHLSRCSSRQACKQINALDGITDTKCNVHIEGLI